jgi:hypothetical protein
MTIHLLSPVIPDLGIPRGNPCSALTSPGTECGATPVSLYMRSCKTLSHTRKIWLCPVHAALAVSGGAICKECAERLGVSLVTLMRLTEPVRAGG